MARKRKAQYDVTQETLLVPLSQPVHYDGVGKAIIKSVRLRRLYAPDLSKLKQNLAHVKSLADGTFARTFILLAKEILSAGVDSFYEDWNGGKEFDMAANHIVIQRLPLANVYKLTMFILMLTKEASIVTTSYKCVGCTRTLMFDLDPESPIPKDIEEERDLMQDFFDHFTDKINKSAEPTFRYKLKTPYEVDGPEPEDIIEDAPDGEEGSEASRAPKKRGPKKILVRTFDFAWPPLSDYLRNFQDDARAVNPDQWALYDNLVRINELTEDESLEVRDINGLDKLFRMRQDDFDGILDELSKYGMEMHNEFHCKLCGTKNSQPFDYSNFFAFLRS